jgi:hypothetical protein
MLHQPSAIQCIPTLAVLLRSYKIVNDTLTGLFYNQVGYRIRDVIDLLIEVDGIVTTTPLNFDRKQDRVKKLISNGCRKLDKYHNLRQTFLETYEE